MALPAELLLAEQSRAARGLRERKRKVKAHNAMRERSNMPPALPAAADLSIMPTFGCRVEERPERYIHKSAFQDIRLWAFR